MFIAIRPTAVLLGAAALLAAGLPSGVHAGNVSWSISVGTPSPIYAPPPVVYVQPQPVYVQPQPVYVQPPPVYVAPRRVFVQPHPVYVPPGTVVHVATPHFGYGPPPHAHRKHHRRHHHQRPHRPHDH